MAWKRNHNDESWADVVYNVLPQNVLDVTYFDGSFGDGRHFRLRDRRFDLVQGG